MSIFASGPRAAVAHLPNLSPPMKKPSFFGEGGTGRNIAGYVGDALLRMGGGQSVYAPTMQRREDLAAAQQAELLKSARDFSGFVQKEEWKRANPEPQAAPTIARNAEWLDSLEPGLGKTYAQNYAQSGGMPPQIVTVPGVGTFAVPKTGAPAAPAGPPASAVDYLRQNPNMAAQFDAKYGQGAAARAMGGPTPPASGSF